jgi:hypothetical protein
LRISRSTTRVPQPRKCSTFGQHAACTCRWRYVW